jgi:beta-glucosidase
VSGDRLTIFDEGSDGWKLVPGNYIVMAGGSSQDLPLHQQIMLP